MAAPPECAPAATETPLPLSTVTATAIPTGTVTPPRLKHLTRRLSAFLREAGRLDPRGQSSRESSTSTDAVSRSELGTLAAAIEIATPTTAAACHSGPPRTTQTSAARTVPRATITCIANRTVGRSHHLNPLLEP